MIVTRAPGNVFHAVNAVCTHAGTIVEPYDNTEFTEAINCYTHGSRYTMDGVVLTPGDSGISQANLPQYNTAFANGVVRVEIPSLNFKLNAVTVQSVSGNNKRLALNFNPRTSGKYRVKYTPDLVTTPVSVNFATTAGGPTNVSLFNATSNSARSLWVDSSLDRGFYFIELVVTQEAALP